MKRKLDEMMGDFDVKQEPLQFEELSELEKRRILAATLGKAGLVGKDSPAMSGEQRDVPTEGQKGEENMREDERRVGSDQRKRTRGTHRKVIAAAVAAVLVVGSAGVFAATGLSDRIAALFHPTEEQAQVLAEGSTLIDKKDTDQGATLWMRETVGDKNSVYILFDFIAPEGTVLDREDYTFDKVHFSQAGLGSFGMGYSLETIEDEDAADNKVTFMLQANSGDGMAGQKMNLFLKDLKTYDIAAGDYLPVLAGEWEVEFKLDYKDISKTVKVDADIQAYGDKAKVTAVSFSPLSLAVEMNGPGFKAYDENPPMPPGGEDGLQASEQEIEAFYDTYSITLGLKLKDGTLLEPGNGGTSGSGSEMTAMILFDRLIDADEVAAVVVNGTEIPVSF